MAHQRSFFHTPVATAALLAMAGIAANASAQALLDTVTITAKGPAVASVGGWGDVPLSKVPFQATVIGGETLRDNGVQRLSDITRLDPAVSDAYNSEGYVDYLTVRGYVIDNRFNYRRDGLPINAETSIPIDNKESIEILKGTSGLQAGTSAPGGLVNFVVKRPTNEPLRRAQLSWREKGSVGASVDMSQRFGEGDALGVRLNAAYEHLRPLTHDLPGDRHVLAMAGDWRLSPDALLEAEFETSQRKQRSVPAMSLLGNQVPALGDPRINLNNQPWSLPVVFDANTASVRYTQKFAPDWKWTVHGATQQLRTDDRLAYPFGCYDASTDSYYADRYCPNGSYDLYDFRSENERRRNDALEVAVHGKAVLGQIENAVAAGVQQSRVRNRFQRQAYNFVGQGNVDATAITPADPTLTDENTNRDERSTEVFLRDAAKLNDKLTAWLGLRHTSLHRESVRTDGSRPIGYDQSFTTPGLALSYALSADTMAYASWGRGTESEVVPNRGRYANPGEALPALKSRQVEVGIKADAEHISWGVTLFDIDRPLWRDLGQHCFDDVVPDGACVRQADGTARHQGIDASTAWTSGPWLLQGGIQWLHARVEDSSDATLNGKQPTNVPARTLKLQARYSVAAVPGLSLQGHAVTESARMVLEDNSVRIPGYGRLDAAVRYVQQADAGRTLIWRGGIDNLLDRRAWRESPFQYGHAYLYPLAERTFRFSVEISL